MTVNVDKVRIYHPRERDEGVETDGLNGEGSRVESEYNKGLTREISREKWRGKMMSEGSTEYSNELKRNYQRKRRPTVRLNFKKRSAPSSLGPVIRMTSREVAGVLFSRSSPGPPRVATDCHRQVPPGRSSPYQLRSRRHVKEEQEESRRSSPYPLRNISETQAETERTSAYLTKARGVETASSSRRFRPYK
ncbi:hypothetical protein NPIL_350301 [Nephila pilipes]|uniref:Uncharacterized protein n=1 Tax=Nephila pilipes TaxID=299642 RepID=A0A8X6TV70_NEPPI|nr:hypothetical protein NPIL_119111 [Nephila pilipes]GFU03382.1 hypothetical protein NPIL_350301 [Nephila pilipes]